jgi:hypothetical protein
MVYSFIPIAILRILDLWSSLDFFMACYIFPNASSTRSGVMGTSNQTPMALYTACEIAGIGAQAGDSPALFAPKGPKGSYGSQKMTSASVGKSVDRNTL